MDKKIGQIRQYHRDFGQYHRRMDNIVGKWTISSKTGAHTISQYFDPQK
jgi:hypothetical protein